METTRAILVELQKTLVAGFREQMESLPIKRGKREDLIAGFTDGVRAGIGHTVKLLGVTVKGE
jgi:hypothetical protein